MVVEKDDQEAKSPASLFLFGGLSDECGNTIEGDDSITFVS